MTRMPSPGPERRELKPMDIAEFSKFGYLQEVNRFFFHPLGLCLVVEVDDDGEERLWGIKDERDDPAGCWFSDEYLASDVAHEKALRVAGEVVDHLEGRYAKFGQAVQPLGPKSVPDSESNL